MAQSFWGKGVRSDLDGVYEKLAVRLVKEVIVSVNYGLESQMPVKPTLAHLLVYKSAGQTMVVSFVNVDAPSGSQQTYYGSARILIAKNGQGWSEIMGPDTGKEMIVRSSGSENSWATLRKLERIGN